MYHDISDMQKNYISADLYLFLFYKDSTGIVELYLDII